MGSSETDASAKVSKTAAATTTTSASQEQTLAASTPMAYPDWPGFQAFSPVPPPGFFHSPVASSPMPHHPYMWGAQQFMPPYGTPPPPYLAMYPHGGLYGHPSIPPGSHPFSPYAMLSPNSNTEGVEVEGKLSEGKEKSFMKRSKGSLGSLNMITGKTNEVGKTSGPSGNGFVSQSGDSASEGSSEGSDANSQNDNQQKNGGQDSLEGEASKNGNSIHGSQNGANQTMPNMPMAAPGGPGSAAGPTTNLNIGMDYWGGPTASPMPLLRGKVPGAPAGGPILPTGLTGPSEPSEHWRQDERELKRQRRKQSNRESARRSRLRKQVAPLLSQAECEELAHRVGVLKEENTALKSEASRIRNEYEQLVAQNTSLKERLGEITRGHDDPRSEVHNQHLGHDIHIRNLESDKQTGETELQQSGP